MGRVATLCGASVLKGVSVVPATMRPKGVGLPRVLVRGVTVPTP